MSEKLKIKLVYYQSPELGEAWKEYFWDVENVEVVEGDLLAIEADTIVSPGNSLGFMDGGLDLMISKTVGWNVQTRLPAFIATTELKELLVGQTHCIQIPQKNILCAPTMRVPLQKGVPDSVNAYLAMKGILREALRNENIQIVAIPGLCTGTGKMSPRVSARQMKAAYDEVYFGNMPEFNMIQDAVKHHNKLT